MRKLCGNVLKKTLLTRGVVDLYGSGSVDRRGVVAGGRSHLKIWVVGGTCTKEIGKDGKHKDGNSRHNSPKMEIYGKTSSYWDD